MRDCPATVQVPVRTLSAEQDRSLPNPSPTFLAVCVCVCVYHVLLPLAKEKARKAGDGVGERGWLIPASLPALDCMHNLLCCVCVCHVLLPLPKEKAGQWTTWDYLLVYRHDMIDLPMLYRTS